MLSSPRNRLWRWSWLVLILPLCVGCGVGPVKETTYVFGTVGPEGGVLTAGDLQLTIPPGAFAAPTAVAVVPETTPLSIQPPPGDPATYTLAGPQWCCGPQGLTPLKSCQLVVHNVGGGGASKPGSTETVLLLWDIAKQALVPAGPAAHYDPGSDAFEVAEYDIFGHVAVGIRTVPDSNVGFAFTAFLDESEVPGPRAAAAYTSGLYVASVDGSIPLALLPTEDLVPQSFIPAPAGDRVLYDPGFEQYRISQSERELFTVGLDDAAPTLVAGDNAFVEGSDPTFGWLHDSPTVFFVSMPYPDPEDDGSSSLTSISTAEGDGSAPSTPLYDVEDYAWVSDVRQSPSGALVLIRYWGGDESEYYAVFEAASGSEVSRDVEVWSGTSFTARFLPDESGLYVVDPDRSSVLRYDLDGTNEATLFTPEDDYGAILDFVLAPNGNDFAYVTRVLAQITDRVAYAAAPGQDALVVGSLTGGVRAVVSLGRYAYYEEMAFHPSGASVFVDTDEDDVEIFAASDGTEGPALHVADIRQVDVHRDDGRLLLTVRQSFAEVPLDAAAPAQDLTPGVYVAQADGSSAQRVDLPGELEVVVARWLRTSRLAPCMDRRGLFR